MLLPPLLPTTTGCRCRCCCCCCCCLCSCCCRCCCCYHIPNASRLVHSGGHVDASLQNHCSALVVITSTTLIPCRINATSVIIHNDARPFNVYARSPLRLPWPDITLAYGEIAHLTNLFAHFLPANKKVPLVIITVGACSLMCIREDSMTVATLLQCP